MSLLVAELFLLAVACGAQVCFGSGGGNNTRSSLATTEPPAGQDAAYVMVQPGWECHWQPFSTLLWQVPGWTPPQSPTAMPLESSESNKLTRHCA